MRSLPGWFGIEQSIRDYAEAAGRMETFVALEGDAVCGFITIEPRSESSAEIHVLAVEEPHHGAGVGGALVRHVERLLRERGFEFLQVKTLGPSRPDANYARTRGFYHHVGFRPLEENRLWGDRNPCLIMVKHLRCADAGMA